MIRGNNLTQYFDLTPFSREAKVIGQLGVSDKRIMTVACRLSDVEAQKAVREIDNNLVDDDAPIAPWWAEEFQGYGIPEDVIKKFLHLRYCSEVCELLLTRNKSDSYQRMLIGSSEVYHLDHGYCLLPVCPYVYARAMKGEAIDRDLLVYPGSDPKKIAKWEC